MAKDKARKKHVCSCGASFSHGISLRRHQRVTGHEGSEVVVEGEEAQAEAQAAAEEEAPAALAAPAEQPADAPIADDEEMVAPATAALRDHDEALEPFTQIVAPIEETRPSGPVVVVDFQKLFLIGQALHYLATDRLRVLGQVAVEGGRTVTQAVKLAALLLAVLGLTLFGAGATRVMARSSAQAPPPALRTAGTAQPSAAMMARSAVLSFYREVDRANFEGAYDYLSVDWHRELSLGRFVAGFEGVSAVGCRIASQETVGPGLVRVDVVLDLLEHGTPKSYQGTYLVVQTSDGWRLDRGHLLLASL